MKWNVEQRNWDDENAYTFRLVLSYQDLIRVELDEVDRAVIRECEGSESCADILLVLETIVRRIEQAKAKVAG